MDYITVEEAIETPGLRLVLTAGVPGPWGEAAKAILQHKSIDFVAVAQNGGGENAALQQWTGQNSAPVIVYEDFPPVVHWLDLLMFTERLAPESPLVPLESAERITVVGLSALIAGVDGFGWNRRLQMLAPMMTLDTPPEMAVRLANKYGWSAQSLAGATARLQTISATLDTILIEQGERGSDYLVGDSVSAADFYWASFSNMVKPLPEEVNPMPDYMRDTYATTDESILGCLTPALEAHRDRMFARHITLPLDY